MLDSRCDLFIVIHSYHRGGSGGNSNKAAAIAAETEDFH